jgi:hypothetical protein
MLRYRLVKPILFVHKKVYKSSNCEVLLQAIKDFKPFYVIKKEKGNHYL